uniref:MyTH4 domain-containing protein n=1 Tax=Seriola lalandi dorsalis TaxID=1841481 RepID=A0A3B4YLE6_SERLL
MWQLISSCVSSHLLSSSYYNALMIMYQIVKTLVLTAVCVWIDSCQRGWRLLYILTAYHRSSEVLKPFLLKYLQQASRSAGAQYQGIAKACEQNLKKTFQYGGRVVPPNSMELKAMMAGRSSKRQLFLFPGGIERHVKIKTCSVALEVIEELCYEMGLHRLEAMEEYAIFLVTNRGVLTHI